jgi:hypothetical protein
MRDNFYRSILGGKWQRIQYPTGCVKWEDYKQDKHWDSIGAKVLYTEDLTPYDPIHVATLYIVINVLVALIFLRA